MFLNPGGPYLTTGTHGRSMGIHSNSLHSPGWEVMFPLITHLLESGIVVQIC